MYIIPDELLDTMNCDICHKYLSVAPVKVYPDRITKCARCSKPDDGGVVSLFKLLAEEGLFKCVNRFDGCNQLLSYTQVSDHEAMCNSQKYSCPLCPEAVEIPTFLLIKHFTEEHGSCFLKTPCFEFETTAPCTKIYLYRVKDYLFFIQCEIISVDTFTLNTIFLGKGRKARRMDQKFTVHYKDGSVETKTKTCDFYGCKISGGFALTMPNINLVQVILELSLPEHFDFPRISSNNLVHIQRKIGLPRKITLCVKLRKRSDARISMPSDSRISVVSDSTLLKVGNRYIIPYCYNCSLPTPLFKQYLQIGAYIYQSACELCDTVNCIPHEKLFSFPLDQPVTYSCIWRYWGCTKTHYSNHILEHDIWCSYQPEQPCPVLSCSHRAKLYDLEKHFWEKHPTDFLSLFPEFDYYNELDVCVSSTPQNVYVWVQFQFILLKLYNRDLGSNSRRTNQIQDLLQDYRSKTCDIKVKPEVNLKIMRNYRHVLCYFDKNHFSVTPDILTYKQ